MKLARIVAAALVIALTTPALFAQSGELKKGIDAYWAGDYSTAVSTLRKFLDTAELRFDILTARKFLAFSYLAVDEKDKAVEEFQAILSVDAAYDITSAEASPSTLKSWKEVKSKKQAEIDEASKKVRAESALDDAKRFFAAGQYAQAEAGFREVLKLDPTNQWAKAYLEQVTKRIGEGGGPSTPQPPPVNVPSTTMPPAPVETPSTTMTTMSMPPAETPGTVTQVAPSPLDTRPETPGQTPTKEAPKVPDVWVPAGAEEIKRYNEALKHNNAGLAAYQQGVYATARNEFERAIQIYAAHPMFHWNLGLAYEQMRRDDLAMAEYQFAIKSDPTGYGAQARRRLGLLYFRGQRWVEAARELEESLRVAPDDLDTRRFLSRAYDQAGNLDMAIQALTLLVQQAPDSIDDRFTLGGLFRKKGNNAAAVAEYKEVLKLNPAYGQASNIQAFIKSVEGTPPPAPQP
ncbi:MAG: tetratricopeptide repeat protein [Acidobacteriota bacterium]